MKLDPITAVNDTTRLSNQDIFAFCNSLQTVCGRSATFLASTSGVQQFARRNGCAILATPGSCWTKNAPLSWNLGWFTGVVARDFIRAGPKVWVLGTLIVIFVVFLIVHTRERAAQDNSIAEQQKQDAANAQKKSEAEAAAAFSGMTAAEHLQRAQLALNTDATRETVDEGLRNLEAIPPSEPESAAAKTTKRKLAGARERLLRAQEQQAQEATKAHIVEEARASARKDFRSGLREVFRKNGADASISDIDDRKLFIASDSFKLKPNRDETMMQLFGPAVRRKMCVMGFNTIELRSGVIFGDGDEYSLGCPETKEEREARHSLSAS
jgi:hypothetical protein